MFTIAELPHFLLVTEMPSYSYLYTSLILPSKLNIDTILLFTGERSETGTSPFIMKLTTATTLSQIGLAITNPGTLHER
jgi:hypothetical protein